MSHLGFISCLADPDIWIRKAKKNNVSLFWEFVVLYTDDVLVVSENGEALLRNELEKYFQLK